MTLPMRTLVLVAALGWSSVAQGRVVDDERREVPTEERPLSWFPGIQLRRGASADQVLGPSLPVDRVNGVLPGTILAMRLGLTGAVLGGYGICGGGTFTVYRETERGVLAASSAYGFVGVGAKLQLHRTTLLAAELDWGQLSIGLVQTAVVAMRIAY